MPLAADLKIETYQGPEIAPYTQQIVKLVDTIYRQYPYLYNGDDAGYIDYLDSYARSKNAIICLVFDGNKIVGIAAGMPMTEAREIYWEPLKKHGYDLNTLFYQGEFGLLPAYHNQGVEEAMFHKVEEFVRKGPYKSIAFWEVESSTSPSQRPENYLPSDPFWKRLGFIRYSELNFNMFWTNINEKKESPHLAVYWLKPLS